MDEDNLKHLLKIVNTYIKWCHCKRVWFYYNAWNRIQIWAKNLNSFILFLFSFVVFICNGGLYFFHLEKRKKETEYFNPLGKCFMMQRLYQSSSEMSWIIFRPSFLPVKVNFFQRKTWTFLVRLIDYSLSSRWNIRESFEKKILFFSQRRFIFFSSQYKHSRSFFYE